MIGTPYLVGITGGSASGKTLFLQALQREFGAEKLCLLSQDNYYRSPEFQQKDENGWINFDLPECIDYTSFIGDLNQLRENKAVVRNEYLFQVTGKEPQPLRFHPSPIIVIEGLFIFYFENIFKQLDLKVFIDAADDVKLERRLKRDTSERGIPHDQVIYQWRNHVLPAYEKYLLPFKNAADMIINNNDHFNNSLEVLKDHFHAVLNREKSSDNAGDNT